MGKMLQAMAKFKGTLRLLADRWPSLATTKGRLVLAAALLAAGFLWFMPWVLTVPLGLTVYWTYDPSGSERSPAFAGPLAAQVGLAEWVAADKIPKACMAAVVAAEDTQFYEHNGLDLNSIEKAWTSNQKRLAKSKGSKKNRGTRGASTITQQLVKNLYLSRERSYLRKAREAAGAVTLELVASKETILAWYLNVVEFGPDIYGLEGAAQHYFKKPASRLRPHECVSLAVVLPSPNRWNASLVTRRYTSFFVRRYAVVARRMRILGQLDATAMRDVRAGAPFFFEAPPVDADGGDASEVALPEPPPELVPGNELELGQEDADAEGEAGLPGAEDEPGPTQELSGSGESLKGSGLPAAGAGTGSAEGPLSEPLAAGKDGVSEDSEAPADEGSEVPEQPEVVPGESLEGQP